jgi:hypothetical protein
MPGIIRASELTGISVKDLLAAREQEAFDRLATAAEQNLAGIRQSLDDIKGDTP